MILDILTLFPHMFQSVLGESFLKRAIERGLIEVNLHDIRDYAEGKHRVTDDAPFGGGGGMVMKVEPITRALEAAGGTDKGSLRILLSPQGEPFRQDTAKELARYSRLVLICGHYEGIDERVREHLADREISIGDFVLTGGEIPAMVIMDAVARLIPGVLGNSNSALDDSHSQGLLEGPHYTRPREFRGWQVPEVLLSGHQKNIELWRRRESVRRTWQRRRDLLGKANLSAEDRTFLEMIKKENDGR